MFHNYLHERGIQVQTGPDGDGGYRVAFSYQNKEYEFTGSDLDDTEAMRKAYLAVYEIDRDALAQQSKHASSQKQETENSSS